MNKGIIFDFDGVIINSFELQKKALFESYRIVVNEGTPSEKDFFKYSGDSLENIFKKMNLPQEMVRYYREICIKNIDAIYVYDGIYDLLQNLKEDDYRCGLCTGKDFKRTSEILKKYHLEKYFDVVVCSDNVKRPKPYSDSLEVAIHKMGISSEDAVMIGDAPNDIICAKNINVKSIGVLWGEVERTLLEKEAPDYMAETVSELKMIINMIFE